MLGLLGIRAGQQQPPSRDMTVGGPHLLTIHDVVVADVLGAGGQAREIRAGPRLGEQLTPDVLTGIQRAQQLELFGVAMSVQGRRRQAQTDDVAHPGIRGAGGQEALLHKGLQRRIQSETAAAWPK